MKLILLLSLLIGVLSGGQAQIVENCFTEKKSLNEHATCLLHLLPTDLQEYKFAILTDPHISIVNGVGNTGYNPIDGSSNFQANLESAKTNKVSFIFITGDMFSYLNDVDLNYYYQFVYKFMERTKIAIFHIPGNHEFFYRGLDGAGKSAGQLWYSKTGSSYDFLGKYFRYIGDPDIRFTFGKNETIKSARFIMSNVGFNAISIPLNVNDYELGKKVPLNRVYTNIYLPNRKKENDYYVNIRDEYRYTVRSSYNAQPDLTYTIDQSQIDAIGSVINNHDVKYTFVLTHMALASYLLNSCSDAMKHVDKAAYLKFKELFQEKNNTIIFSGHTHPSIKNCEGTKDAKGNWVITPNRCECFQYDLFSHSRTVRNYIGSRSTLWTMISVSPKGVLIDYMQGSSIKKMTFREFFQ
ncbi:MAG: hypothetical protein A2381_15555 [Bdellovibrionales bacterium RIFOXYB1_FULL_37_110]|nr:MAG: hypothetical protein A2417_07405 [Bdellovibrionales bacterium RIFOXYC1_FULL_37_79]OFZ57037.1 MAG: hypothetical protein A2381_15555 [Bdellovibrionales bacterium RIFOXYB1_FULL_37_110]OFZ64036.1 MAG: hypothetical protein A2577_16170 [Bdellovibrionales bacterium RIFOXYD1_FULL_36_51]